MAALEIDLTVTDLPLAAATPKTALQIIAPATNKVKVGGVGPPDAKRWLEISFDGTSATDAPVLVQVMRQTTVIGGSPVTVTPVKHLNGADGAVQTTAKKSAGGSEPTSSDVYWSGHLHPQGRHIIPVQFVIEQSDRLGVVCTAATTPNVTVTAPCEE